MRSHTSPRTDFARNYLPCPTPPPAGDPTVRYHKRQIGQVIPIALAIQPSEDVRKAQSLRTTLDTGPRKRQPWTNGCGARGSYRRPAVPPDVTLARPPASLRTEHASTVCDSLRTPRAAGMHIGRVACLICQRWNVQNKPSRGLQPARRPGIRYRQAALRPRRLKPTVRIGASSAVKLSEAQAWWIERRQGTERAGVRGWDIPPDRYRDPGGPADPPHVRQGPGSAGASSSPSIGGCQSVSRLCVPRRGPQPARSLAV